MMPHLAEECWQVLGQQGLVSEADWPQIERDLLVEDTRDAGGPGQRQETGRGHGGRERAKIRKLRLPFWPSMR